MNSLQRKKLRTILDTRFRNDPVAKVALKEYELDQKSVKRTNDVRAELTAIHAREMQNLRDAADDMLRATVLDLTARFEKRLEEMTRGTDEKIEPVRGKAKSMGERMDALEALLTGRHGKLSESVDRLRKRVEKFTDYVVGGPSRSFYVNGALPSAYFSDTNLVAGSGITLTPSTNQVNATADVTISATGTAGDSIFNEVVSGSGTSWTLANTPIDGTVTLYARGQRLTPGVDYNISGANIVTIDPWSAGDLLADYQKQP